MQWLLEYCAGVERRDLPHLLTRRQAAVIGARVAAFARRVSNRSRCAPGTMLCDIWEAVWRKRPQVRPPSNFPIEETAIRSFDVRAALCARPLRARADSSGQLLVYGLGRNSKEVAVCGALLGRFYQDRKQLKEVGCAGCSGTRGCALSTVWARVWASLGCALLPPCRAGLCSPSLGFRVDD